MIETILVYKVVNIVSAARSLTCRDDLDSKWRLLLAENELSRVSTADATYLVVGEGSRELIQQATNVHIRPPFCELR